MARTFLEDSWERPEGGGVAFIIKRRWLNKGRGLSEVRAAAPLILQQRPMFTITRRNGTFVSSCTAQSLHISR